MTDVKPFVARDSSPPQDRTVSVVFVVSGLEHERPGPGLLHPLGPTCLFDRMLSCLERVCEASQRAVWFDDATLVERFESVPRSGIRLLAAPPDRSLRAGGPDALLSTHVALFDGRHPFLRSSTIDEAVRLLRLRGDIEAILSCVRVRGPLYSLTGQPVAGATGAEMLLACHAFSILPSSHMATGRALTSPPFAFEIASSEAFRVESAFLHEMAAALIDARAKPAERGF
jgi:hypothetical protein